MFKTNIVRANAVQDLAKKQKVDRKPYLKKAKVD